MISRYRLNSSKINTFNLKSSATGECQDQVVGIFVYCYLDAKGYLRTPRIVLMIVNTYQAFKCISIGSPIYCNAVVINAFMNSGYHLIVNLILAFFTYLLCYL